MGDRLEKDASARVLPHGAFVSRRLLAAALCLLLALAIPVTPLWAQGRQALTDARQRMVEREVMAAGIRHPDVIRSMHATLRHEFVPRSLRDRAYFDMALPIGDGQTISPPFVVAYMTEQLEPKKTDRVLEIGTGSGYQAAVLSSLVQDVYSIEIVESLGRRASRTLKRLGYDNVHVRIGDGYQGWPEQAPFDKIVVTCSPEAIPTALARQLDEGGRMIVPIGRRYEQTLQLFTKQGEALVATALLPTLFVPMTGTAETRRRVLPNPARPGIVNGGFEEGLGDATAPRAWHYARQMARTERKGEAREGAHVASFQNDQPGRGSQALQALAVDGRRVAQLDVSCWVQCENARSGSNQHDRPGLVITFYDTSRRPVGSSSLGPWLGTFDWREDRGRLAVPLAAREAIVRIGLLGATGRVDLDDVRIRAVAEPAP